MMKTIRISFISTIFVLVASLVFLTIASAGSVLDRGQLVGLPAQANYIAWVPLFTPPNQILTEDGYNSSAGVNQGYQADRIWRLNASNFTNPPAIPSFSINMVFGGLGSDTGNLWSYSFPWDNSVTETDHGIVGTQTSGNCPIMLQGSQDGTGKTINWSGISSEYLIYRSTNASGAGNGASNGRYDYVATIPAGTFTYEDNQCATGNECWHIVVPSSGGVPNGCHSEESNPTAITLSAFSASSHANNPWVFVLSLGLLAVMIAVAVILRRRTNIAA